MGGPPFFFFFFFFFFYPGEKPVRVSGSVRVPPSPSPCLPVSLPLLSLAFSPMFISHFWRSHLWLCTPVLSAIHVVVHAKGVHNVNSNAFAL